MRSRGFKGNQAGMRGMRKAKGNGWNRKKGLKNRGKVKL